MLPKINDLHLCIHEGGTHHACSSKPNLRVHDSQYCALSDYISREVEVSEDARCELQGRGLAKLDALQQV